MLFQAGSRDTSREPALRFRRLCAQRRIVDDELVDCAVSGLVALRARQGTKRSFFTEVCGSALEQRRPSWTVAESSSEYPDLFLRFACSGLCFDWTITSVERRFRHASPLRPDIRPTSRLFLHFSQITRRCLARKTLEPKRHRSRNDIGTEKTPKKAKRAAPPAHPSGARLPSQARTLAILRVVDPRNHERVLAWRIRGNACAHLHAGAHLGHNVSALHETLSRFFLRIASQRSRHRRAGSGQDRRLNPGKRLASSAMHTAGAGATKAENRWRKRNTTDRRIDLPRSRTATLSERAARSREVLAALRRVRAASAHVGRCPLDERDTP